MNTAFLRRLPWWLLAASFPMGLGLLGWQAVRPTWPQGQPLAGAVVEAPAPRWSWSGWWSGRLMSETETWFNQRVGFRPFWVRLENQLNLELFSLTSRHAATRILVGRDRWLFKLEEFHAAFQPSGLPAEQMDATLARYQRLERALAKLGKPLLLVIAPNKSEIYPERLPPAWVAGRDLSAIQTDYERLTPAMSRWEHPPVDATALFQDWKATRPDLPLFTRGGTHWSFASALEVVRAVTENLNPRLSRPFAPLRVVDQPVAPPRWSDRDLTDLANFLDTSSWEDPTPFPVLAPDERPPEQKPSLLVVGDSFAWTLLYWLFDGGQMCREAEMLYYTQARYTYPGAQRQSDLPADWDWEALLARHDAVILVQTQVALNQFGYGFLEAALPAAEALAERGVETTP